MTQRKKRNKLERAFSQGFKSGIRGRNMEACPYSGLANERGYWFGGWREGRSNYLSGCLGVPASLEKIYS